MGKKKRLKALSWQDRIKQQPQKQTFKSWLQSVLPIPYVCAFFFIILISYWNSFFNGFVWDDIVQIVDTKDLVVIQNIPKFFAQGIDFSYRPLFYTTISTLNSIFGLQPFYYHAFSIMLHVINTCLVFILGQKFFSKKIAAVTTLIFAVHPMNVESVAYIASLSELLYFQFGCISLLLFIIPSKLRTIHILTGCLFLLLALLAKETAFLFIIFICLYVFLFNKKQFWTSSGSLLTMFCAYLFVRLVIAGTPVDKIYNTASYIPMQTLGLGERLMHIPAIFQYYLSTFFFPHTLQIQQYWLIKDITTTNFYLPILLTILTSVVICLLGKNLYSYGTTIFRTYLFFLGWFTIGLIFHFQLLPLSMTVADRWFYVIIVGLLGLLACTARILPAPVKKKPWLFLCLAILGLCITGLVGRTIIRTADWKSNYTLYTHDIATSQPNFSLENDVAFELIKRKHFEEAKPHIDESIKLAPDWWLNWTNLGIYYEHEGKVTLADQAYAKAIDHGNYVKAYELASSMHLYESTPGSTNSAKRIAQEGLMKYPSNTNLWELFALANYQLGDKDKAAKATMQAYKISRDERYKKLSEIISQGIDFTIKQ